MKLLNYLQNQLATSGVPLHCIVRKDIAAGHLLANLAEALIYECPLNGLVYTKDNRKVPGVIKQSVADTQYSDWIKPVNISQYGRATMTLLRTHFDGPGEVKKRIAHTNNATEKLHYTPSHLTLQD